MTAYIALLRKKPSSDFGVDFPDFPGCATAGKTLEKARTMAAEALELYIVGMLGDVARHDGDGSEHRAVGVRSIFSNTNSSVALKTGVV